MTLIGVLVRVAGFHAVVKGIDSPSLRLHPARLLRRLPPTRAAAKSLAQSAGESVANHSCRTDRRAPT